MLISSSDELWTFSGECRVVFVVVWRNVFVVCDVLLLCWVTSGGLPHALTVQICSLSPKQSLEIAMTLITVDLVCFVVLPDVIFPPSSVQSIACACDVTLHASALSTSPSLASCYETSPNHILVNVLWCIWGLVFGEKMAKFYFTSFGSLLVKIFLVFIFYRIDTTIASKGKYFYIFIQVNYCVRIKHKDEWV